MKFVLSLLLLFVFNIDRSIAAAGLGDGGGGIIEEERNLNKKQSNNKNNIFDRGGKDDKNFRYIFENDKGNEFDYGGCDFVKEKPKKRCKRSVDGVKVFKSCPDTCKMFIDKKMKSPSKNTWKDDYDKKKDTFVLDYYYGGCDFVKEKPKKRCNKSVDGVKVFKSCPDSCKKFIEKKMKSPSKNTWEEDWEDEYDKKKDKFDLEGEERNLRRKKKKKQSNKKNNIFDRGTKDDKTFRYIFENNRGVKFDYGGCDFVKEKPKRRCNRSVDGVKVFKSCPVTCKMFINKKVMSPSKNTWEDDWETDYDKNKDKPKKERTFVLEGNRLHAGCDAYVFKSKIQCDMFGDKSLCMITLTIVGQLSETGTVTTAGLKFTPFPTYGVDIDKLDPNTVCISTGLFRLDDDDNSIPPVPLQVSDGCASVGQTQDYLFVVKGKIDGDGTIDLSFSRDKGFDYYTEYYENPLLYKAVTLDAGDDDDRRRLDDQMINDAPACKKYSPSSCEDEANQVLTKLDFFDAKLTESSLHWVNQTGRMVYSNIGLLRGDDVDLVVTQAPGSPPYTTSKPDKNGYSVGTDLNQARKFGNINLMSIDPRDSKISDEDKEHMNGEGTFEFCFYYSGTDQKARVDSFSWTVFDLDNRRSGLNEKLTIDTSQASRFYVESDTEVKMWCEGEGPEQSFEYGKFQYVEGEGLPVGVDIQRYAPITCDPGVRTVFHSTRSGTGSDNPTDPESLNKQQLARSIQFRFENTQCWTFKYEHYCPCGEDNYCGQRGGGPADCNTNRWCPKEGHSNYDENFPNACNAYSGGNFMFSGQADEQLSEGDVGCSKTPESERYKTGKVGEIGEYGAVEEGIKKLEFSKATLTENTLHWLNQTGRLVYENIAVSNNGEVIDLVVTQAPGSNPYTTKNPQMNGYDENDNVKKFGNINVMTVDPGDKSISDEDKEYMNGEGTFEFCFYYKGTDRKARLENFLWYVSDLDNRGGGLNEKFTIDTAQASRFYVQNDTEVKMWCEDEGPETAVKTHTFQYMEGEAVDNVGVDIQSYAPITCRPGVRTIFHSTTEGIVEDNPRIAGEGLTKQQSARSIEFRFENTQCWTFKYEHYCPCGDDNYCGQPGAPDCNSWCPRWKRGRCKWYSGANIMFSGEAT